MELKLYSAKPVGDVGVVDTLDKYRPRVGVIVWDACWLGVCVLIKWPSCGAVDERPEDLYALDALSRRAMGCHIVCPWRLELGRVDAMMLRLKFLGGMRIHADTTRRVPKAMR
jgi:hypothetical protein